MSQFSSENSPLLERFLSIPEVSIDSRTIPPRAIFFALKGPSFDGNKYALQALKKGASLAVVDDPSLANIPGVKVVPDSLVALQWLAHSYRKTLKGKVLAIGGSNGKTTTKGLIFSVASQKFKAFATPGNFNNHIGVPISILRCPPESEFLILEMGANHVGEHGDLLNIATPDVILITNIGKDHLEGFGGERGVKEATKEFFDHAGKEDIPVFYNPDGGGFEEIAKGGTPFGTSAKFEFHGELVNGPQGISVRFGTKGTKFDTRLRGRYNFGNILSAIIIGQWLGIADENIKKGLILYTPETNRSQVIRIGNLEVFLDCYNANPTSMKASLESFFTEFPEPISLILGGMKELGKYSVSEHQKIIDLLATKNINKVFLIGNEFEGFNVPKNFQLFANIDALKGQWNNIRPLEGSLMVKGSRNYYLEKLFE